VFSCFPGNIDLWFRRIASERRAKCLAVIVCPLVIFYCGTQPRTAASYTRDGEVNNRQIMLASQHPASVLAGFHPCAFACDLYSKLLCLKQKCVPFKLRLRSPIQGQQISDHGYRGLRKLIRFHPPQWQNSGGGSARVCSPWMLHETVLGCNDLYSSIHGRKS